MSLQRVVSNAFQDVTELNRTEQLLAEENHLLKLIASGHPVKECLLVLTEAVSRLCPNARAAVLMTDDRRGLVAEYVAAHLPASIIEALQSATTVDNTAIFTDQPVIWTDVNSNGWSHSWRELRLEQDIRACYSTPIINADRKALAWFFLCFGEAHDLNAWEHHVAEFGAHIAGIVIERDKSAQLLHETETRLAQELADSEQLQKISAALIEGSDTRVLYNQILDAAVTVMHSEMASMQMLYPERNELELLAYKGFHPESATFWHWVRVDSGSTCGAALRTGERVIVEDVETCDFIAGTADLDAYRKSGIRAVQSTPLISRSGRVLGMISNHWRRPHLPSERDWRLLGILTRQAADLIERNEAEEKLRESEQKLKQKAEELEKQLIASGRLVSVGEITASMAHEFNNPLGIVIGFAEDLLTNKDPSDPDFHALQIIHAESQRCAKLVNDIIEFGRPRDSAFSTTDVGSLIAKSLAFISNRLYKDKIKPVTQIAPNLPPLSADAVQIEQVLLNLYLNAIDAMPDGGKLIVEVAKSNSADQGAVPEIIVSIADSGKGIDEQTLPYIFRPFFTFNKKHGLGLGLPICERIIKNHGGRIEVESQLGKGTIFKLHLPIRDEVPARIGASHNAFKPLSQT